MYKENSAFLFSSKDRGNRKLLKIIFNFFITKMTLIDFGIFDGNFWLIYKKKLRSFTLGQQNGVKLENYSSRLGEFHAEILQNDHSFSNHI